MNEIIAETKNFAISPEGEKKVFHIVLAKPCQIDENSWAGPVQIEGMYKNLAQMVGQDSWQALALALALVHNLLGYYVKDGGSLYWRENGDEITLSNLFPLLSETSSTT